MPNQQKAMFAVLRRQEIAAIIQEKEIVLVDELCRRFSVSAATIRTDLTELERTGVLKRTHGGAVRKGIQVKDELTSAEKEVQNIQQKQAIANAAMDYICPGSVIALDTGTTTLELAKLLPDVPNLTVITNDIKIASVLESDSTANVLLLGGFLRHGFHCTIGKGVSKTLKDLYIDVLFLATNGMSVRRGFSTPSIDVSDMKRAMIEASARKIVLADSSKANHEAFSTFANLKEVDCLITDRGIDQDFRNAAAELGLEVLLA